MEKEPQVRQAEAVMTQAAADMQQVMHNYSEAAFTHAHRMASQALGDRITLIVEGKDARDNIALNARAIRVARISDFRQDAQRLINTRGLDKENTEKAQSWLSEKIGICTRAENEANQVLNNKCRTDTTNILSLEHAKRATVDRQLEYLANYLKEKSLTTGWTVFSEFIVGKTAYIENLLDAEKLSLINRLNVKRNELQSLIGRKDGEQERRLDSFDDQLRQLLDRLESSQSHKQASNQQRTGSNNQNRHTDSRSNNADQNRRREDPRIRIMMGKDDDAPKRPYEIVLANIDHHRKKDKSDAEIYRMLAKHFHPDRSNHEWTEEVIRVLTSSYDSKDKKFRI